MENEEGQDIFEEEGVDIEKKPVTDASNKKNSEVSLLNKLKITVSDPEKKTKYTGLKMQETFVVYLVESRPIDEDCPVFDGVTSLWRRYSEFELLRNYLVVAYPMVIVPPLPEKRANFIWTKISSTDTYDVEFIERRRVGLESFLHRIVGHSKLCEDDFVKDFISQQNGWRDKVIASGFQAKSDSWLKKMNASLRVKHPDIRLEQLKHYANHLQSHSSSLLKVRAKIAERVFGIYKIHGNYVRVFKDWALTEEQPLRDVLQKASNSIDTWTNSIDALVDEEDLIAEQLKEYLYFADSLKNLCKKHEAMQYDLEWYENELVITMAEKKRLQSGNTKGFSLSGMKARLLGADSPEKVEQKVEQLDKNISDLEEKLNKQRSEVNEFLEEAVKEVESFKNRKVLDLNDIFVSYAVLQIKLHKEGATIWQKFKSVFDCLLKESDIEEQSVV